MKDLYKIEPKELVGVLEELRQDADKFKDRWGRVARKCVAYANGDHSIGVNGTPTWVDNNPVNTSNAGSSNSSYGAENLNTNEIEPIIRTLTSYLTRSKPTIACRSVSQDGVVDKAVAKVSEDVINAKYDIDDELLKSQDASTWALTVGTIFGKDYWDPMAGSYYNGAPTGSNASKILTPFSVSTDYSVSDDNIPYIFEDNLVDTEWLINSYSKKEPGYTGEVSSIQKGVWKSESLDRLEAMKTAVPYLGNGGGDTSLKSKSIMTELFVPPYGNFPQGRMIVIGGGSTLYATPEGGENPYFFESEPYNWNPYTKMIYEPFLGRYLGKGLVEQLIPLQMRLNEINAAIVQNANTVARPHLIGAEGQLKKGIVKGGNATVYTYRNIPGVGMPTAFEGIPLPTQFFNERQQIIDQMVRIAGTNFIMQGTAPTGVTAASAIQQLLENASTQNAPLNQRFQKFLERRFEKKLRLLKKFQTMPDGRLNSSLREIATKEYRSTFKIFIGSKDLADNVQVRIESSSMIPKSEQSKSDALMELVKNGFFQTELQQDGPKSQTIKEQILDQVGLEPFLTDESVDMKKAKWENERILNGEPVEASDRDIHPVHIACHREMIQNPQFLENATDAQKLEADTHLQEHEDMLNQAQQGQQQQEMAQQKEMAMVDAVGKGVSKGEFPLNVLQ